MSACISSVSVGFMPAVGSSSSRRRGRRARARGDLEAAPVGVGKAVRGMIETRRQPVAE